MDDVKDRLIKSAVKRLKGPERRMYQAEVCRELCESQPRRAEKRFGWCRNAVKKGLEEITQKEAGKEVATTVRRPYAIARRSEVKNPQLALDIQLIVEPKTQCDPEMKSTRVYTNMTSKEVRQSLLDMGYTEEEAPAERTIRDILQRMNYRLKRIQKSKPIKKTEETDAIFANVNARRAQYGDDTETLEISVDTKAKVALGEYSQGGKSRTDSQGNGPKALDHDMLTKKS
jgi:hypothetical protein